MAYSRIPVVFAFFLFFFVSLNNVEGLKMCKRKTIFGAKSYFTCPEPGQSQNMVFCCGDDDDYGGQYCCSGLDIENGARALRNPLRSIGSIIATIAGVIGFLIILFIICCCICPCCILYKRRQAGTVYRSTTVPSTTGPSGVNVTVVPAPAPAVNVSTGPPPVGFTSQVMGNQGPGYPVQPNYPPQPGYPTQPGYPAQPGYPMQPVYPAQPGYPPYPQNAAYSDQPPPYPGTQENYQKQAPYNPNY